LRVVLWTANPEQAAPKLRRRTHALLISQVRPARSIFNKMLNFRCSKSRPLCVRRDWLSADGSSNARPSVARQRFLARAFIARTNSAISRRRAILAISVRNIGRVAHEAANHDKIALGIDRWKRVVRHQIPAARDTLAPALCVTPPAARQRRRPDAENFGGEVSF
jgi:hypothetical protein